MRLSRKQFTGVVENALALVGRGGQHLPQLGDRGLGSVRLHQHLDPRERDLHRVRAHLGKSIGKPEGRVAVTSLHRGAEGAHDDRDILRPRRQP